MKHIKFMNKFLFLFLLVALSALQLKADRPPAESGKNNGVTYYVNASKGNNSNKGTTQKFHV